MANSAHVVIIVDGDLAVHELVAEVMRDECAVLGATAADVALKIADQRPPSVAIIDATLGAPAALALVHSLRDISPHMQVVVLAPPAVAIPGELVALGPVLHKPIDRTALGDLVKSHIRLKEVSEGVDQLHHGAAVGPEPGTNTRRNAPTRRERPR